MDFAHGSLRREQWAGIQIAACNKAATGAGKGRTMRRATSLLVIVLLGVAGCATGPFGKKSSAPVPGIDNGTGTEAGMLPGPGLLPAPTPRFPDIPLPQGLKEDIERSYVYESATLQIGRMVYTSRDALNELARFYLQECPGNGWELDEVLTADGYEILFEKPGKRLTVTIRDLGMTRGRLLVLNLVPED